MESREGQRPVQTINFTRGVPANESFPIAEVIEAAAAVFKDHGAAMLQYGPSLGFLPLREWLAEWQQVAVDRVLTSNGSLQLIEFLCLRLIRPGDVVLTESPTYDRTLTLLRRHGATVVGVPLEADGPDVAALEDALKAHAAKFFYTIPDFQNPAGATCSGPKRRAIAALAEKYGFLILEDAPYRPLRYRGTEEPTLFKMAPQRTLHMMEQCGVDLLLAGHLHMGYSGDVRTHYEATKRSILSIQAGTAISTRHRSEPNAYNLITLRPDEVDVAVRAWDGKKFAQTTVTSYQRVNQVWERRL